MLCLRGCASCLEHAKRHCLLLNQDFLLNSLQQLSHVCLEPPDKHRGLFLTEQLHPPHCKCLDATDEVGWGGQGCKASSSPTRGTLRYRISVGKKPEVDLINSFSALCYENKAPAGAWGPGAGGRAGRADVSLHFCTLLIPLQAAVQQLHCEQVMRLMQMGVLSYTIYICPSHNDGHLLLRFIFLAIISSTNNN